MPRQPSKVLSAAEQKEVAKAAKAELIAAKAVLKEAEGAVKAHAKTTGADNKAHAKQTTALTKTIEKAKAALDKAVAKELPRAELTPLRAALKAAEAELKAHNKVGKQYDATAAKIEKGLVKAANDAAKVVQKLAA